LKTDFDIRVSFLGTYSLVYRKRYWRPTTIVWRSSYGSFMACV